MTTDLPYRQRFLLYALTTLLLCLATSQSQALTKEQRADQYLLQAQEAYRDGKHRSAVDYFSRIESLGVSMPAEFHFFYGSSLAETGNHTDAYLQLSRYLNQEGRGGRQYQNALSVHAEVEQKVAASLDSQQNEVSKAASKWRGTARKAGIDPNKVASPGTQQSRIARLRSQGKLLETVQLIDDNLSTHKRLTDRAERLGKQFRSFRYRNQRLQQAVERDLVEDVNSKRWQARTESLKNSLAEGHLDRFEANYRNWDSSFDQDYRPANTALNAENKRLKADLQKTAQTVHQKGQCRQLKSQLAAWRTMDKETNDILREMRRHDCR